MNTNIKILIGVVVVVILLVIGIIVFKHRENFNGEYFPSPEKNFHMYMHHLYHAINQTILPDFYNADRTVDITRCSNTEWPPSIQNEITIQTLNDVYRQFKSTYKNEIDKVVSLYLSTDSVAYTAAYNALATIIMNMSIPDPNEINLTRLNAYIVLTGSPDIQDKLDKHYGEEFAKIRKFVENVTPL